MDPDKREVDLGPVERIWRGTSSAALPEDFNWERVALNYAGAIRKLFRNEPELRAAYKIALQEQQAADIARIAGAAPGLNGTLAYSSGSIHNLQSLCLWMALVTLASDAPRSVTRFVIAF